MAPEQDAQSIVEPDLPRAGYSLWCAVCGQAMFSGIENLKIYSEFGWPRCCEEVMYCGPAQASMEQQPD